MSSPRRAAGLSLVELLIVIAIMAILAAAIIPSATPAVEQQLQTAARVLTADLAYARSLAVTHGSNYRITFDKVNNRYTLEHTGTNGALDNLPDSPYRNEDDPPNQHIVCLDDLPHTGAPVKLTKIVHVADPLIETTNVEYGPLGETTDEHNTLILLTLGEGDDRKGIYILIHAVTGNTSIGRKATDLSADLTESENNAIDADAEMEGINVMEEDDKDKDK
ncbi:MAG: prepilin-type N-terminal cleavage/methylation domain-containing protein, partial [Pirellulales bacterium]|nr:prepilin-type N-terminal cleavage/methylation domain-containing protein [Pirellulales bacterium]